MGKQLQLTTASIGCGNMSISALAVRLGPWQAPYPHDN
jgi:hypothetical protein